MLTSITPILFPSRSPPPFPPCVSSGVLCICFVSQEWCDQNSVCVQALRPAIEEISTLKRVLGPANIAWPPLQNVFRLTRAVGRGATSHPRRRLTDQQANRSFGKNKLDYLHSVHLEIDGSRCWLPKELKKYNEKVARYRAARGQPNATAQTPAPQRKIATAVTQNAQKRLEPGIANASAAQPPEMPCQHEDFHARYDDSSDDSRALKQ